MVSVRAPPGKGFAFVEFTNNAAAKEALYALDGVPLLGKSMNISMHTHMSLSIHCSRRRPRIPIALSNCNTRLHRYTFLD